MFFKRGDSQIDWVIAGSMFVIFLAFFFLLAKPLFKTQERGLDLTESISNKLDEELFWTIQKVPLLASAARNYSLHPLRAKVNFGESTDRVAFADNTSIFLDGGYVFGVKPLERKSVSYVVYSNDTYDEGYGNFELSMLSENITTHDLVAEFTHGLINRAYYQGQERISDFSIHFSGINLVPERYSSTNGKVLGRYQAGWGNLNSTFYVYSGTPIIDQRIDSEYDASLSLKLTGYDWYYIDEANNGNASGCIYKNTTAVAFYKELEGLVIILDEPRPFFFCKNEDQTTQVNISFGYGNETFVRYAFYEGVLAVGLDERTVKTFFGIPLTTTGVSAQKLASLNSTSYDTLKKDWNYPTGRDFRLVVRNSTTIIGNSAPEINVKAKEYKTYLLDKYGNKDEMRISVQTW